MVVCSACGAFVRAPDCCPSCGGSPRRGASPSAVVLLLGLAACGPLKSGSTNVDYGVSTFTDTETTETDTDTGHTGDSAN